MARTVADAAVLLGVLAGADPRDPSTARPRRSLKDSAAALDAGALKGARIGVARRRFFGYSPSADRVIEAAIAAMKRPAR